MCLAYGTYEYVGNVLHAALLFALNETKTEKIIVYELCSFKAWPAVKYLSIGVINYVIE